ncbi:GNAT family N-acetyltransferase [Dyadobacter luteus]|jgi:ribosomal protein S18 acetylase RimI-like enzyme|uniref:GNAT family N-acetyltransferase n=1 Tax=Dyadobacter luteus TaxID=2259619 RepID=A0A3D8YCB5_9BACT|nr:GNAT family N-acetyltransferase [Dyadobacter luteus]REA62087.1 GNAT family N-acetyltransferase [Dyadobacter luteus]
MVNIYLSEMIRPATPYDAAQVAPLFILAMGHIAGIFANSDRYEDAIPFFENFFKQSDNQYSYAFTQVMEEDNLIIGSITGYDGADLHELRKPILDQVRKTKPGFLPDDETEAGEYYLDCINVHPAHQGKGIGQKLIEAFCERARSLGYDKVGLIVDLDNPRARKFYENQGFSVADLKSFMGHRYFHMVKALG